MRNTSSYENTERKREKSSVEIPDAIDNEFAVVLWFFNVLHSRDEGFLNHHLYGDIHFWRSALIEPKETYKLEKFTPVIFSGHKKNEGIVVDKLTIASPDNLSMEMTCRLIELIFDNWKHGHAWKEICKGAVSDKFSINEQTEICISLLRKHKENGTFSEHTLQEVTKFFSQLDHSKLAPYFKDYLSDQEFIQYAFRHNLELDEQTYIKVIENELLNGKYENGIPNLITALKQNRYRFQTATIVNILKQVNTEDQLYKTIHLDLYNSGFSWSILDLNTKNRIQITSIYTFNRWYEVQLSTAIPIPEDADMAYRENRIACYIRNFYLTVELKDWAESLSLGYDFLTPTEDDILHVCKHTAETELWEKIKRICDIAIEKENLPALDKVLRDLVVNLNVETLHIWRFVYFYNLYLCLKYPEGVIEAFEMLIYSDAKTLIWSIYHDCNYHDGFKKEDVISSLMYLTKEEQCRILNRLIAEARTMEEVKNICNLEEITSLGNTSIEKLKLFLNFLREDLANTKINKAAIFNAYINLLIHSEGIAELEHYLPLCNYRNMPSEIRVTKNSDSISVNFEGAHSIHKCLYGYTDDDKYKYHHNEKGKKFETIVFGNAPCLSEGEQNDESVPTPTYCEGRIVINKKTNKHKSLSKSYEIPYYWCFNEKCVFPTMEYAHGIKHNFLYTSSLEETVSNKFGLLNVFGLWGLKLNSNELANVVCSSLNSAQRFFKHLKCNKCNIYLTPSKSSNYAYFQTNLFACSSCGIEVYLSHCLNSSCSEIVDSRESKKCPNEWYICNSCLACCDDERIKKRSFIRKETGQSELNMVGHREKHIFCPKCGQQLDGENNPDPEKSLRIIKYLETADKDLVKKKGSKDGKWFLVNLKVYAGRTSEKITADQLARRFASYGLSLTEANIATPEEPWYLISDKHKKGNLYSGAFTLNDVDNECTIICDCGFSINGSFTLVQYHNREKKEQSK